MVVCVVAIGLWDHSGDIEYASHLVLIPLYTMAIFALQEMYGYLHPQMEFFMMRKVLRFIYNVILTIMFWLSVWFIVVLFLWMILGCVVNPDKMASYAVTAGAVLGVATSSYATFKAQQAKVINLVKDQIVQLLEEGISGNEHPAAYPTCPLRSVYIF